MEAFDNTWLCRYPRPQYIGYDNGNEFIEVFKEMCKIYAITPKPNTEYNPQANSIIERVHATLGNMLRTFQLDKQELKENDPWPPFLNSKLSSLGNTKHVPYSTRCYAWTQLVFGRDMLLPITFKAQWADIVQRKQEQITRDNARENSRRIPYEYKVGDKVLINKPGILRKMDTPREGPYTVTHVHTNGTVRIQRGAVSTRINIRRLTPYHERTV